MKFRVQLKTTVTRWVNVEVQPDPGATVEDLREWAADDAVATSGYILAGQVESVGLEHGPIELAYEELDESVEVVA